MGLPEFISEEIEVEFSDMPGLPAKIFWRGKEYRIVEVEGVYRFLDLKKPWWRRRHRDFISTVAPEGNTGSSIKSTGKKFSP